MSGRMVGQVLAAMDEAKAVTVLRELAAACFVNAQTHYETAILLAENSYSPAAVALAVIGAEEFAKAIVYALAALLPDQRSLLGPETRWHELKHLIAAQAEGAQIENSEGFLITYQESGTWPSKRSQLEDMFRSLVRGGLLPLVGNPNEARDFYEDLQTELPESIPSPVLKNAALYVDLSTSGEVLTPARVDAKAAPEILGLEWFLEVFRALPRALKEDEAWKTFADYVCQSRGAAREL